jgi:protein-S-isoprenylcysteine O-methyltransferase Ste14
MKPYIVLSLLWLTYFALHSIFADKRIKKKFQNSLKYYRLIYSVLAILLLLPIAFYMLLIPSEWIWQKNIVSKFFGLMLATYGVILFKISLKSYNISEFLGLKQAKQDKIIKKKLSTDGLLKYVRHPMYSASLLLIWGYFVFAPHLANLITIILFTLYFVVGTKLEEKKLVEEFGAAYSDYQKKVPMFIPHLPLRK